MSFFFFIGKHGPPTLSISLSLESGIYGEQCPIKADILIKLQNHIGHVCGRGTFLLPICLLCTCTRSHVMNTQLFITFLPGMPRLPIKTWHLASSEEIPGISQKKSNINQVPRVLYGAVTWNRIPPPEVYL